MGRIRIRLKIRMGKELKLGSSLTLITLSRNPLLIPLYCRVNGGSDTPPVGEHEAEEPEDELGGATLRS